MPFESMGQRGLSAPSCFLEDICFSSEKEIGFWKPQSMHYCQDGKVQVPYSKSVVLSPLGKNFTAGELSVDCLELPPCHVDKDHKVKCRIVEEEGTVNCSRASREFMKSNQKASPNWYLQAMSCSVETNKPNVKDTQSGNSLSSSTSSEVFGRKLASLNNVLFHKSDDAVASCHEEDEPFGTLEEMEEQTIGNLLPDEDNLFSGVVDELECMVNAKGGDDAEDFDLFSSIGGMELEVDDATCEGQKDHDFTLEVPNGWESSKESLAGTHPYGEQPSRTLFVRNITCHVEESELRVLFEQYGDVRNLYTTCKHRGFVMISYFDLRAATNAMRALQNKQLGHRKLDIHYSVPKVNPSEKDINQGAVVVFNLNSSVSNDDLHQIFGIYGEIKEIREIPRKCHHKFIEFYDVRAAEAACRAFNECNIAGNQIELGRSFFGARRDCLMQKCSELERFEAGLSRSSKDISSSESMSTVSHGGTTVSCIRNGSVQGLCYTGNVSLGASTDNVLCHDNSNIFIPHKSSRTVANMTGKTGSKVSDRINGRHTNMAVSHGQPMELEGGVSGPSEYVTSPVYGHRWSNLNQFQLHPSSPMAWPSSPLVSGGVSAPFVPQLPAFSGISPEVLNTVSPASHPYHLCGGSAPAVSSSIWDRQHVYTGKSCEGLAFCLGSQGKVGFTDSSPLHLFGRDYHVFSRDGGSLEKSTNDALHSPHQMSHTCGQNTVTSLPTSFGYPHACRRNLSHRRNQGSSSYTDKKQFELDTVRILRGEDSRTTLMIKNIPNKYTSKMLLTTIDEHCRGTYDFIYLPIDFKNKCNVGYAFINLIDPLQIIHFHKAFDGKKWEKFNSEKVAALAYARIQGKAALVAHFQNSSLMNEDKRCRPILFHTNGQNAGEQVPFPMGTKIRLKASKARSSVSEEFFNQGSPLTSVNGEDSPNRSDSSGSSGESY